MCGRIVDGLLWNSRHIYGNGRARAQVTRLLLVLILFAFVLDVDAGGWLNGVRVLRRSKRWKRRRDGPFGRRLRRCEIARRLSLDRGHDGDGVMLVVDECRPALQLLLVIKTWSETSR